MELIQNLEKRLQKGDLPGRAAQFNMTHGVRRAWFEQYAIPANAAQACTLALLYPKMEGWYLALMQRVTHANDKHSGQISLPGGRVESQDTALWQTAVRETEEEVGVSAAKIAVIGQLTEVYIPVSNYLVFPFVGYTATAPTFQPDPSEVAQVIEVPLAALLDPVNQKRKTIELSSGVQLKDVPYFDVMGHTVWGATAMMLAELVALVTEAG